MIYIEVLGRMGNQMFSYAFARMLQEIYPRQKEEKIAFDFTNYEFEDKNQLVNYVCSSNIVEKNRKCSLIQRVMLKIYFSIRNNYKCSNEKELDELEQKWKDILSIFGIYLNSFNYHQFKFKPITKNFLLLGYFESPEFFEKIDEQIRLEFKPKSVLSPENIKLLNWIENTDSVCIGVRRGDFVSKSNVAFCSVCTKEYYNRAIKIMDEKVKSATFFIFTEDPDWAKENLCLPENSIFVGDENIRYDDKLYVMSKCKHFIISNSTYIWWAQHLSDNTEKIVIAPDRWRNVTPETHTAIYEKKSWIVITTE